MSRLIRLSDSDSARYSVRCRWSLAMSYAVRVRQRVACASVAARVLPTRRTRGGPCLTSPVCEEREVIPQRIGGPRGDEAAERVAAEPHLHVRARGGVPLHDVQMHLSVLLWA